MAAPIKRFLDGLVSVAGATGSMPTCPFVSHQIIVGLRQVVCKAFGRGVTGTQFTLLGVGVGATSREPALQLPRSLSICVLTLLHPIASARSKTLCPLNVRQMRTVPTWRQQQSSQKVQQVSFSKLTGHMTGWPAALLSRISLQRPVHALHPNPVPGAPCLCQASFATYPQRGPIYAELSSRYAAHTRACDAEALHPLTTPSHGWPSGETQPHPNAACILVGPDGRQITSAYQRAHVRRGHGSVELCGGRLCAPAKGVACAPVRRAHASKCPPFQHRAAWPI